MDATGIHFHNIPVVCLPLKTGDRMKIITCHKEFREI